MKQNLRFRGGYCPNRTRPIYLLIFVFLLIGVGRKGAFGQFHKPSAISRSVGDTLPESFYQTEHQTVYARTGERKTIRLADHRDKLIILDFWATWCKPCIGSLNRLDSIRRGMDTTAFVIVPVTYQTAQEAAPAFDKFGWDLTSIVADTTLSRIFPHGGIPHMIWIRDGKVLANPVHHAVTAESIASAATGKPVYLRSERATFDFEAFANDGILEGSVLYQASILKGAPNFYQQRPIFEHRGGKTVLFLGNVTLVNGLYGNAFSEDISEHYPVAGKGEGAGIHVEASGELAAFLARRPPEARHYPNRESFQLALDGWRETHLFSYGLLIQGTIGLGDAYAIMRQDLNAYFGQALGLRGAIELRPKRMVAITTTASGGGKAVRRIAGIGQLASIEKEGRRYRVRNAGKGILSDMVSWYGAFPPEIPVVECTGWEEGHAVDLELRPRGSRNPESLNEELEAYGLRAELVERMEPVLVLSHAMESDLN